MSQTAIELLVAFTQLVFFIQMCSAPKVGIPVVLARAWFLVLALACRACSRRGFSLPTRLGLFTLVVAGCVFSLLNYPFLEQADEEWPIIFIRLLVVRLLYQFGFRGI